MLLNNVDIFACRFFTVNKEKKLQFFGGAFRGKTADDFKNLPDLQKVVAYCFWILGKEDIPTNTKYAATVFLKDLFPKFIELEKKVKHIAVSQQKKLQKETEELTKTTGKKYA